MTEIDLQEATRRDDVYLRINKIVDELSTLGVFPSLMWVWSWDMVKDKLDYYDGESGEEYKTNPDLTEKDVWDLFWRDADENAWSLEYGMDNLHEGIFNWMLERDIIIESEEED